jgi:uncharacterized protein YdiU (UPF0061 family)
MKLTGADFTNVFRDLSVSGLPVANGDYPHPEFKEWHAKWLQRLHREGRDGASIRAGMQRVNPVVIPRNHRVEEALAAAEEAGDLSPLGSLLEVLQRPFDYVVEVGQYSDPPLSECNYRTFCGT